MKSALSWAALCVCPPAIVATSVATVPSVKRAVHHATAKKPVKAASRAAKPVKTASIQRPPCAASPMTGAEMASLATLPPPKTDAFGSGSSPVLASFAGPGGGGGVGGFVPVGGGVGVGGGIGAPGGVTPPTGPEDPTVVAPIPEPQTWVMMIAGFGLMGWLLRRRRERTGAPVPVLTRLSGLLTRRTRRVVSGVSAFVSGNAPSMASNATLAMAAKATLCICPTVGLVASAVTVPPVRSAVHAATATPGTRTSAVLSTTPDCDPTIRTAMAPVRGPDVLAGASEIVPVRALAPLTAPPIPAAPVQVASLN